VRIVLAFSLNDDFFRREGSVAPPPPPVLGGSLPIRSCSNSRCPTSFPCVERFRCYWELCVMFPPPPEVLGISQQRVFLPDWRFSRCPPLFFPKLYTHFAFPLRAYICWWPLSRLRLLLASEQAGIGTVRARLWLLDSSLWMHGVFDAVFCESLVSLFSRAVSLVAGIRRRDGFSLFPVDRSWTECFDLRLLLQSKVTRLSISFFFYSFFLLTSLRLEDLHCFPPTNKVAFSLPPSDSNPNFHTILAPSE